MTPSDMESLARQAAARYQLDPELVCAVVEQESSWNPWVTRCEPAFLARYIQKLIDAGKLKDVTEEWERAMSWGLMQLMGESAREHGYVGPLGMLLDPATNLEWGCVHLLSKLKAAGGDTARALELWNGGGNPNYASEVLGRLARYQTAGAGD